MKYCYSDYFDIADGIYNDIVLPIVSKAKDEESY